MFGESSTLCLKDPFDRLLWGLGLLSDSCTLYLRQACYCQGQCAAQGPQPQVHARPLPLQSSTTSTFRAPLDEKLNAHNALVAVQNVDFCHEFANLQICKFEGGRGDGV